MVYHIDEWHFAYFYTTQNEGVYYDIVQYIKSAD